MQALVQTQGVRSTGERERRGERRVRCGTLLDIMVSEDAVFTISTIPGLDCVRPPPTSSVRQVDDDLPDYRSTATFEGVPGCDAVDGLNAPGFQRESSI